MTGDDDPIDRVREAIRRIRTGEIVVLVDDEDRENEGDLCMAAEKVTPEAINFMARHGRGLICLTLAPERVAQLGLQMMVQDNQSPYKTAFTVSIEARCGVTTGISAADRAATVLAAVAPGASPDDIVSPGHVFPLRAVPGGVLQRTGQTEGSVDLARLAGLEPAGVICEVMRDDGTMARMPDLEEFSRTHGVVIVSVADIIQYRLREDRLVRRSAETEVRIQRDGLDVTLRMLAYEPIEGMGEEQYLALIHGDPAAAEDGVLCRVHTGSIVEDVFGVPTRRRAVPIQDALRAISREPCGVLLYVPSKVDVKDEVELHGACADGPAGPQQTGPARLREFGLGAQILRDLGIRKIRLLTNNPRKIVGLKAYGLEIADRVDLLDPT
jgi:3,4-dihydroxy 2-butanone 4-phosphate synthase/GTP cyclohydrolase II